MRPLSDEARAKLIALIEAHKGQRVGIAFVQAFNAICRADLAK